MEPAQVCMSYSQTEERRTCAGHQWSMAFHHAHATVLACKAKILVRRDWPSRSTWPCREASLDIRWGVKVALSAFGEQQAGS